MDVEVLDLPRGQQPYSVKSREELLGTFDKNVAEARELIGRASDEHLQKTWTLKLGWKTIFRYRDPWY
jgi:hypothetical protein